MLNLSVRIIISTLDSFHKDWNMNGDQKQMPFKQNEKNRMEKPVLRRQAKSYVVERNAY